MAINYAGKKIKEVYYGGRKIKEAWYGGKKVYSSKPVEVIPPTPNWYTARDWLEAKLTKYGTRRGWVTELPFDIDAKNATSLAQLFKDYATLVTVPEISNTNRVTNMDAMFYNSRSIQYVPEIDASAAKEMTDTFYGCASLKDGNVRLIRADGTKPRNRYNMIAYSGLTREPFYLPDGTPI